MSGRYLGNSYNAMLFLLRRQRLSTQFGERWTTTLKQVRNNCCACCANMNQTDLILGLIHFSKYDLPLIHFLDLGLKTKVSYYAHGIECHHVKCGCILYHSVSSTKIYLLPGVSGNFFMSSSLDINRLIS